MASLKINIILPFVPIKAGGGLRVMFEYANYLADFGHQVTVYFPTSISYRKTRIPSALKYAYFTYIKNNIPDWFIFSSTVDTKIIHTINNSTIKNGDIIFSTWWSLVFDISKISPKKGTRFNLIQDIENWLGNDEAVIKSYTVDGSNNIVIASYLYEYIFRITKIIPYKIPFAIDGSKFYITKQIDERNPHSVIMLYSTEPRKGTVFGLEALLLLKKRFPELNAKLFGVYERPADIPDWIEYFQSPQNLNELLNTSAVFLGPSKQEGCALPPMEAMHSGCAVICTDIDGHKDYAIDQKTAIMAKTQDPLDMCNKIASLFSDSDMRIRIAYNGNGFIRKYTWFDSARFLEAIFTDNKI